MAALAASTEPSHGLSLETTYTGKCLAALIADAKADPPAMAKQTVLFWNTHSSLALPGTDADVEKLPAAVRAGR